MWRIVFLKLVQNYFSVGDGDSKVGYFLKPEISMKCHSDGVETTCTTFWIPLLETIDWRVNDEVQQHWIGSHCLQKLICDSDFTLPLASSISLPTSAATKEEACLKPDVMYLQQPVTLFRICY
jgi:hypothetical protein